MNTETPLFEQGRNTLFADQVKSTHDDEVVLLILQPGRNGLGPAPVAAGDQHFI